ncbi:MAG: DNA repair protein RecN [Dorea sp.]|jgi:DNA repair protein RecN|nr:DNA repair protein RecN [Dorea sp.]
MLRSLHVKNLALIDEIEVEFERGLNILTGETGAGKSIILGSVNLALGGKYTKDMIREGADYGYVELTFEVENTSQQKELKELDIFPEEGFVVLSRRLMERRSVSRINGETVTMSVLKAAAAALIDIHGQHEHQSLLYKKNHLGFVDAFAGEAAAEVKDKVHHSFQKYQRLKKQLEEADMDESQRVKEMSFLAFEADEIDKACLKEEEDEELEILFRRMTNGKKIAESILAAYSYTSGQESSASESLSRAIRLLSDIAVYDKKAEELYNQLGEIDSLLNDFNRELSDYLDSCEFSEEEFYETEKRLNEINHLKTKYGSTIEDILAYGERQKEKLEKLENHEEYIKKLKTDLKRAEKELKGYSKELSGIRNEQGKLLEKKVEEGLKDLNFADVKFEIALGKLDSCTSEGMDDVEFKISLNPGQPVRPLVNVASGGELSRIMLAIKTVMADRDDIETLIFDEIDVGISGRTAQKVSEKMGVIGRRHQVICITHLAQIAAMADTHFLIEKNVDKKGTTTGIRRLAPEEETEELARILGGAKITETVLQNAREMKALAKEIK